MSLREERSGNDRESAAQSRALVQDTSHYRCRCRQGSGAARLEAYGYLVHGAGSAHLTARSRLAADPPQK